MSQDQLVELGRTGGAYGVRGWIRVVPVDSGEVFLKVRAWVLRTLSGEELEFKATQVRRHGAILVAKLEGVDQKEEADALRGPLYVRRSDFPDAGSDEVWAVDLIGCEVVNRKGDVLGTVESLGTNGVQDLLNIRWTTGEGKKAHFFIPMVSGVYIDEIDETNGRILVDYDADWR